MHSARLGWRVVFQASRRLLGALVRMPARGFLASIQDAIAGSALRVGLENQRTHPGRIGRVRTGQPRRSPRLRRPRPLPLHRGRPRHGNARPMTPSRLVQGTYRAPRASRGAAALRCPRPTAPGERLLQGGGNDVPTCCDPALRGGRCSLPLRLTRETERASSPVTKHALARSIDVSTDTGLEERVRGRVEADDHLLRQVVVEITLRER